MSTFSRCYIKLLYYWFPRQAKAYLQKLEGYKEIGFQEKDIHEAYAQTLGDWDLALDVLTRGR